MKNIISGHLDNQLFDNLHILRILPITASADKLYNIVSSLPRIINPAVISRIEHEALLHSIRKDETVYEPVDLSN